MIITKTTNSKNFFSVHDAIFWLQKCWAVVVCVYTPKEYLNVMRFEFHNQIFLFYFLVCYVICLKLFLTLFYAHFQFEETHRKCRQPKLIKMHKNMHTSKIFPAYFFFILIKTSLELRLMINNRMKINIIK